MRASKNSLVVTNPVEIYSLWKRRHFTRLTDKEVLLEEQYSEPASSHLTFSQNSLENNCVWVLSCRAKTCNFMKKEATTQVFLCKFCEISKIAFL